MNKSGLQKFVLGGWLMLCIPPLWAVDPPGEGQGTVVPSAFCRGLFIVPITWKEETLHFVLDTGASVWSIDPDGAERVRGRRTSTGKNVTLRKGTAGPLKLKKIKARVHEMDHLALALRHDVDGIVGFDTFDDIRLTLDYADREVRVGGEPLPEADGHSVFRDYGKSRPYLRLELNDELAVPVLIDSGSTGRLTLHEDDPLSWKSDPTMVHVSVRYSRVELEYAGRLQGSLQLGPLTLQEPIIELTGKTRLVGSEILSAMELTFDRPNRRIRMIPYGDSQVISEPYLSLGLGLRPRRTGLEVTGIFKGTPAEQAGIAKGDLLTHVDGQFVYDRGCEDPDPPLEQPLALTLERAGQSFGVDVKRAVLIP